MLLADSSMKLDSSSIRALLTPAMVLDHFEIQRRGVAQWSVHTCPACGQLKRGSVSIHSESGLWKCFAGDVCVLTDKGTFPIKALAGKRVRLLVPKKALAQLVGQDFSGSWKECAVRSFGHQEVWELVLSRNGITKTIKTTADHRWFLQRTVGAHHREVITSDLRPGNRLACLMVQSLVQRGTQICPHGVAHGFVFGDGNISAKSSEVVLFGEKDAPLARYFYGRKTGERVLESGIIGRRIGSLPRFFKRLPDLDEAPTYIAGFLAGLFAADGWVCPTGFPKISCADKAVLDQVQTLCHRIGITTYEIYEQRRIGKGKEESSLYNLPLLRSTLPDEFFLLKEHRRRFKANKTFARMGWRVKGVRPLGLKEEVFCAVVPGEGAFTLEGNILTGNCHHCSAHGGLFDLVAGYAGIDPKLNFQRVLGMAAVIAGVPHGVPDGEYKKLLEEHRAKRVAYNEAENARRDRIRARMPSIWKALDRRHGKGESYLRSRGIDPDFLYEGDAVRYSAQGDPAVRLHDLATGNLTGIQYRMLSGDSKLLAHPGSQTAGASLIGRLAKLEKTRLAILVEGLADTLVAQMLWRDAAVFGAPGAEQLEAIATAVAAVVAKQRGLLLIVPDNDPNDAHGNSGVGIRCAARAVMAAASAGLELVDRVRKTDEAKVQIVDLGRNLADQRHHDLADAWKCSRWRWHWPEETPT